MYYYYYYYGESLSKITLRLKFHHEDGAKDIGLTEFNEFLSSIDELNKRIIYLSQPEYHFPENLSDYGTRSLLGYHELNISTLNRENPFLLNLTIQVSVFGNSHYWALWKILIYMCKKYGKSTDDLNETIKSIWTTLEKIYEDLKPERWNKTISDALGESSKSPKTEEIMKNLKRMVEAVLTDAETKRYYEYFCKSLFTIDELIGITDMLDFDVELIRNNP